jgi:hypothetical protein
MSDVGEPPIAGGLVEVCLIDQLRGGIRASVILEAGQTNLCFLRCNREESTSGYRPV